MEEKKKYHYLRQAVNCGNGQRKWITAKTKEELEEKVLKAKLELSAGVDITDNTTVKELAQAWYDLYKKPRLKENTLITLGNVLDLHIFPAIGKMKVKKVRATDIINMMNNYGYDAKACNSYLLSTTRAIFDFAMDNDMILKNPVPRTYVPCGKKKSERVPLTPDQTATLLKNMKGKPAYLFTLVGLSTGLRAGEICGLLWKNVDLDNAVIHVRTNLVRDKKGDFYLSETLKTATSKRDVPIPLALYTELKKLAPGKKPNDYVVTNRKGEPYITALKGGLKYSWKKALPGVHVHPHLLRHTYATRLVENKALDIEEVAALLGHADTITTSRTYIHYDKSRAEETAEKFKNSSYASSLEKAANS